MWLGPRPHPLGLRTDSHLTAPATTLFMRGGVLTPHAGTLALCQVEWGCELGRRGSPWKLLRAWARVTPVLSSQRAHFPSFFILSSMLAKFPSTVAKFSRIVVCTYKGERESCSCLVQVSIGDEDHPEEILFKGKTACLASINQARWHVSIYRPRTLEAEQEDL